MVWLASTLFDEIEIVHLVLFNELGRLIARVPFFIRTIYGMNIPKGLPTFVFEIRCFLYYSLWNQILPANFSLVPFQQSYLFNLLFLILRETYNCSCCLISIWDGLNLNADTFTLVQNMWIWSVIVSKSSILCLSFLYVFKVFHFFAWS